MPDLDDSIVEPPSNLLDPVPVSAYVGSSKNLKDLKDLAAVSASSATGGGEGRKEEMASDATEAVVWDRSTLERLHIVKIKDLCRDSGLSQVGTKPDLVERILDARTFAASLRAKHPTSFEHGASGQGSWWGFMGHYGVLEAEDLETEATFSALCVQIFNP
ncbi:hypothetical protein T484DRAFT_3439797 [Baffinella frigidus]|nr:hypothetical protein T484DRAFT_3439797 [Cryptophyta sp. CCMP2293]